EARPVPTDRPAMFARVAEALQSMPATTVAMLSDGLAADGDEAAFSQMLGAEAAGLVWVEPRQMAMLGVSGSDNLADAFVFKVIRPSSDGLPRQALAAAHDDRGRRIAETAVTFQSG